MTNCLASGLLAVLSVLGATPAHALLSYQFSGTNGSIIDDGGLIGGTRSNLSFVGSFDIDPNEITQQQTFPAGTGITIGNYIFDNTRAVTNFQLTIDGILVQADQQQDITFSVQDGTPGNSNPLDSLSIVGTPDVPSVAANAHSASSLSFNLSRDDGTAVTDASLPTSLELNNFDRVSVFAQFRDENDINDVLFQINGSVTQLQSVPEPSLVGVWLLLATGAIAARRRRGQRC